MGVLRRLGRVDHADPHPFIILHFFQFFDYTRNVFLIGGIVSVSIIYYCTKSTSRITQLWSK